MDLNIAEILFDSGEVQYRYSRYLAEDGKKWVRHGLFAAYYKNGQLASEGHYVHGVEHGAWRDFHENGQVAAEGKYENGKEIGQWQYWNADGRQQEA